MQPIIPADGSFELDIIDHVFNVNEDSNIQALNDTILYIVAKYRFDGYVSLNEEFFKKAEISKYKDENDNTICQLKLDIETVHDIIITGAVLDVFVYDPEKRITDQDYKYFTTYNFISRRVSVLSKEKMDVGNPSCIKNLKFVFSSEHCRLYLDAMGSDAHINNDDIAVMCYLGIGDTIVLEMTEDKELEKIYFIGNENGQ